MPRHATSGTFKKGHPGYKKPGDVSEFTTLKNAFIDAFKEIGGKDALIEFYNSRLPGNKKALLHMMAQMLPKDVTISGNPDAPLTIRGVIEHATGKPGGVQGKVPDGTSKLEGESGIIP
jgi:hypothetical protein